MQPVKLELLAPAKTSDIGIAAIDCGADAVYIAGPGFGARAAAGNPVADIARLTAYAHKFSAKIYATVNTIVYEDELQAVQKMIWDLYDAGVDALIVQDLGITRLDLPPIELHASTQCAIRTPGKAAQLASLGFKRLILERQLSLEEIRAIHEAVPGCELEFFVHGAICVCYSGNCYLSQYLTGRSANRGACIQACRSLYDVVDGDGNVLLRDKSVLSPKDYCLDSRLEELADAGICSFKIEGRLKNFSYVKNLCRHYRGKIDEICARRPEYGKASSGTLEGGFTPNPSATFNRGYTKFFIDGKRARWNSLESTKSIGEYVGTVKEVQPTASAKGRFAKRRFNLSLIDAEKSLPEASGGQITMALTRPLANGDGLIFVSERGLTGMRADVVKGDVVTVKDVTGIAPGDYVYRNYNIKFEKELETDMPRRKIDVEVVFGPKGVTATDADGFKAGVLLPAGAPDAEKQDAAVENIRRNMGKRTGHFDFRCTAVEQSPVKFYPASELNALRRELASALEKLRVETGRPGDKDLGRIAVSQTCPSQNEQGVTADYRANCANHLAREVLAGLGFERVEDAYELKPVPGAELMRSRYCVKYELGLCPKLDPSHKVKEPLALVNAGRRLKLSFDCKNCEMIVTLP